MLIYLATPIDQANSTPDRPRFSQVDELAKHLSTEHLVYRPERAFSMTTQSIDNNLRHRGVESINRVALSQSDILVASLPWGVRTVGVHREIEYAVSMEMPVVVCTDDVEKTKRSFSLSDVDVIGYGKQELLEWVSARSNPGPSLGNLNFYNGSEYPTLARKYPGDAGWDLTAAQDVIVSGQHMAVIPTAVAVAPPPGLWLLITGRSSSLARGLVVHQAVIDSGYRGFLDVKASSITGDAIEIKAGTRIAQVIPMPVFAASVDVVELTKDEFDKLPHDGRGTNGFGSTGE